MNKLILATETEGDKYCDEVRDWFYGTQICPDAPSSMFRNESCLFAIAEFVANKDGITLYESRAK